MGAGIHFIKPDQVSLLDFMKSSDQLEFWVAQIISQDKGGWWMHSCIKGKEVRPNVECHNVILVFILA